LVTAIDPMRTVEVMESGRPAPPLTGGKKQSGAALFDVRVHWPC